VAYKLLPFFNMIENVFRIGGDYGESLREECQDIKFVSLKDFIPLL
jgi:hypothetical protein